jgi:DmsE family decaheme c-type cytochrome
MQQAESVIAPILLLMLAIAAVLLQAPLAAQPARDSTVLGQEAGTAANEGGFSEGGFSEGGADTCLGCHNSDSMRVIFATPHGQRADPESPMAQLQCEACHGPGGQHAGRRLVTAAHAPVIVFGRQRETPIAEQDAVCLSCHRDDLALAWTGSSHERNDTGCAGCHSVHTATDPVTLHATQNELCFDCHRQQRADSRKPSSHPLRVEDPVRAGAMICSDCHNPHGSVANGLLARPRLNDLCFDCHAEYRGPTIFEHAPVSEDCSLCHQPHGSIHAPLLTRRAPLLCQSCHSQRGHPSVSFTDGGLAGGRSPSPMVLGRSCTNCHTQVHGSNHPSGDNLMR